MKRFFLSLALFTAVVPFAIGCQLNADYVAQDRNRLDTIGPEHLRYVNNDSTLTLDEKESRNDTIKAWHFGVDTAQGVETPEIVATDGSTPETPETPAHVNTTHTNANTVDAPAVEPPAPPGSQ